MLPPDFAAFSFQTDGAGSDDALADSTLRAAQRADAGEGRIAVLGAGRFGLLVALARRGARIVASDPSRLVLRVARDAAEMAQVGDRVELFAADPRDVVIPGGVDAALVTSFTWRVLLTREAHEQALQCLARGIRTGGVLCIDVDRLPPSTTGETERTLLRRGPGGQTWWWRRDPARALVTVSCEAPRAGPIEVALSDVTVEQTADLLQAAGFRVEVGDDVAAPRSFLVAHRA